MYKELSAITVVDLELVGKRILATETLERVMSGDEIYGDAEALEIVQMLDLA